jgi:hypothetical protein
LLFPLLSSRIIASSPSIQQEATRFEDKSCNRREITSLICQGFYLNDFCELERTFLENDLFFDEVAFFQAIQAEQHYLST